MKTSYTRHKCHLSKEDIENLSFFFCLERNGLLATVFSNFPLPLKRHSIQVGSAAGLMATYAPESAIPQGMTREDYANAVRYGGFYHDIGAFLVYNQHGMYPEAGERLLREQISERALDPAARKVILEIVRDYGERVDGQGYPNRLSENEIPLHAQICGIVDAIDDIFFIRPIIFKNKINKAERFIRENTGLKFSPEAADCFIKAREEIEQLYARWKQTPPLWHTKDLKPLAKPIEQPIG